MRDSSKTANIWHIIIGGTIGNLTEWYNFLLYGYLASVISTLFFPSQNELLSLTLTFTVFAVSFFARPVGGILFGWIGDTYGRQRALVISLIMMTIPTFLIGCLPVYSTIGIASPILLCLFRILQGLSAGGEHTGSAIYVAEYAPPERRTLWISTVPTSAALGILVSSVSSLLIVNSFSNQQLLSWGWRTGFWAGTVLCLVSLVLRITLPETPYFKKIQNEKSVHKPPLSSLFKDRDAIKKLMLVFCLASSWGVFYQILYIWMPTFLTAIHHFSHHTALQINSLFMLIFTVMILLIGYIGDKVSRKFLLMSSCAAMLISAYPLFTLLSSGSLSQVYLAMGIFTLVFSMYIPAAFACMVETFNTQIRYSGLSLGFNCGLAIFGGTTPLVVTWLIEVSGNHSAPAFYMMTFAMIAFITSIFLQDKRGQVI